MVATTKTPRILLPSASIHYKGLVIALEGKPAIVDEKKTRIVKSVISLLSYFCVFNLEYPKGLHSSARNVFYFLDYVLFGNATVGSRPKVLPLPVTTLISSLK